MTAERLLVRSHNPAAGFLDCLRHLRSSARRLIQSAFGRAQPFRSGFGFARTLPSWCTLDHGRNPILLASGLSLVADHGHYDGTLPPTNGAFQMEELLPRTQNKLAVRTGYGERWPESCRLQVRMSDPAVPRLLTTIDPAGRTKCQWFDTSRENRGQSRPVRWDVTGPRATSLNQRSLWQKNATATLPQHHRTIWQCTRNTNRRCSPASDKRIVPLQRRFGFRCNSRQAALEKALAKGYPYL